MYTAYFGFNSKPFKPKDSKDYYRNANFDGACADILDGIRERRGFILLTGEAGVGKTLVLRRCMQEADDVRFVLLGNANLDFPDILNYLSASLELPTDGLDPDQRPRLLLDALAAQARRNRAIALLLDDAQHLPDEVLLRLRDFVETPTIPNQRLQVVLVGLPEMDGRLDRVELRPLRDSIRVRCRLERLSDLETELFIAHQFEVAGHAGSTLLSPAAVEQIRFYCKGIPRAIAVLCDTVLLLASLQSEREITPELVDEAAQSCFLGEQSKVTGAAPGGRDSEAILGLPSASSNAVDFDLDLSEFDFSFDYDEKAMQAKTPAGVAEPVEATALDSTVLRPLGPSADPVTFLASNETRAATLLAEAIRAADMDGTVALPGPEQPTALAASPAPAPLDEFVRLLDELSGKLEGKDLRDQEALRYFRNRYLRLAQGGEPARLPEFGQRIARLGETQQPISVGLATAVNALPGQDGVLCVLLLNPTWWLYREIRLRLRSTDLVFANDGKLPTLRLLDGRDAQLVYLNYRYPLSDSAQTTLWLELDLCDHRGKWTAYDSRSQVRLDFPGRTRPDKRADSPSEKNERFWPEPLTAGPSSGAWLWADSPSSEGAAGRAKDDGDNLVCTYPLELRADKARTDSLRTATDHALSRGTPLTRALLLAADPSQAPGRIELVSRPFMVFGRHSSTAGTGFGDFTLGFVPKYTRISRLHCVICALGDQLAVMPASDVGHTYTGRNGQRLPRGCWEFLESDDTVDICDLYRLKLVLAWDRKWERTPTHWDPRQPREKFGRYLLDLVEVLRQRDRQAGADDLRKSLRERYLNLLRVQDRVAQLNGVGNPGSLLYARFEREDAARRQVVHFYLPKWVSLGNSPQAGLRIEAGDVKPHHAELLFREGMYWIQNLAEPGAVRVGHHGLATNEVLALETGDVLMIGSAQFTFEAY
ncbi:MAG: AAA family ATPase [Candidatus Competibacteraceae bacterium]|nr:AAA family ATPase [Candidatus Competibacteraceae bacterium]MBK9951208.1 AAA family ATPase [Candidatus Competibacteraceae bacterium]